MNKIRIRPVTQDANLASFKTVRMELTDEGELIQKKRWWIRSISWELNVSIYGNIFFECVTMNYQPFSTLEPSRKITNTQPGDIIQLTDCRFTIIVERLTTNG